MNKKVIVVIFSLLAMGASLFAQSPNKNYQQNKTKMDQLLNAINVMYVDSVDFNPLLDKAIDEMERGQYGFHSLLLNAASSIRNLDVEKARQRLGLPPDGRME